MDFINRGCHIYGTGIAASASVDQRCLLEAFCSFRPGHDFVTSRPSNAKEVSRTYRRERAAPS